MGTQPPLQKGAELLPNFRPMSIVAKRLDGSRWHGGGPWSRPHCARWGPSSPPQKGDRAPQFSADFYCDQTARCIKMPLGMEVGLSPGDFVLDGDPASLPKKGRSPQFSAHVYSGQMAAWIKMQLGTEVGLCLRDIVRWGPSSPPLKGHSPPPIFGQCRLWPNGWMD